ncbi:RluA family pseudouridine synthase [Caldifermentibacillus hisashii]|uniref:RluA family pseudouridine synthase n=1 Tax=Caldifermentibacillus hisashii TaxID=996558 RepID=UPI0034D557AD
MAKPFILEWVITQNDHGKTTRQYLQERGISKTSLTDIKLHGGNILVDGIHVTVRHVLKKGEQLTVIFPVEEPSQTILPEKIPLYIVYEDDYVLVINKPAFINTIPSREHPTGSLVNALMGYYKEIGLMAAPHIVTRLDRNTSGLVLVAKHRHMHHILSKQQQEKQVKREYEAFIEGTVVENNGTIEAPIGRKQDSIIERTVTDDGQYACTHFQIIERYGPFTHVRVMPETGRTHQIRVHMAYIGHPLVGDDLYGGSQFFLNRQALHCRRIQFLHPVMEKTMEFSVPLPEDMEKLLQISADDPGH